MAWNDGMPPEWGPVLAPEQIPPTPGDYPATRGEWTHTNGLGGNRSIPYPAQAGERIALGGVDGLHSPTPVTFCLSRTDQFSGGPGLNCDVRAHVTAGVGAGSFSFECDWNNGVQIALVATGSIRFTAVSYAPDPTGSYNAGTSRLQLSAGIGASSGGHPQPRYSRRLPELPPGISATQDNPEWAESLNVALAGEAESADDPYNGTILLDWRNESDITVATIPLLGGHLWYPIPSNCRPRLRSFADNPRGVILIWRLAV